MKGKNVIEYNKELIRFAEYLNSLVIENKCVYDEIVKFETNNEEIKERIEEILEDYKSMTLADAMTAWEQRHENDEFKLLGVLLFVEKKENILQNIGQLIFETEEFVEMLEDPIALDGIVDEIEEMIDD